MSINKTPNQLNKTSYNFVCDRIPNTIFQGQTVSLPGLSLDTISTENQFSTIVTPGEKLTFDNLTLSFLVDSELDNWIEIFNWMISLGFPESFDDFGGTNNTNFRDTSDSTLIILNNKKIPNIKVKFFNMFPVSLGAIDFDSTTTSLDPIQCSVTFAYNRYKFEKP